MYRFHSLAICMLIILKIPLMFLFLNSYCGHAKVHLHITFELPHGILLTLKHSEAGIHEPVMRLSHWQHYKVNSIR